MSRYARPENFGHPIRNPLLREHFVYRAFNAAGELLYVGCTKHLTTRLSAHRGQSRWGSQAVRVTACGPYNYETARQIEYDAIETERSLHNYSSERRALAALHQRIIQAVIDHRVEAGVEFFEAMDEGIDVGEHLLPYSGLEPIRFNDLTLPNARRIAAECIGSLGESA